MKKLIQYGTLLLVTFSFQVTTAQDNDFKSKCGTEAPPQQWEMEFQKLLAQTVTNKAANKTQQAYTIPVIMHVIHGGQPVGSYPNLAQGQLTSQIQVLNNDYAGTGYNSGNYPANAFATWASTAGVLPASLEGNGRVAIANCNVQFCLAMIDPDGNVLPEPGIERINYNSMGWQNPAIGFNTIGAFQSYVDGTIKPQTIWDVTKYLNIWITDYANTGQAAGLLGYATFPPLANLGGIGFAQGTASTDGFWCYARAFGSVNTYPQGVYLQGYTRGRTSTHEIGHWLGLRHIWGDATCGNDYCNDTPVAYEDNYGAPNYPYNVNACGNTVNGEMFMNFMDYTNDNAKYMYTTDQANRVQTAMANSPYRKYLGTHNLCSVSNVGATALFNSPYTTCTGLGLNLVNNSTGWPPPTFSWSASGGTFSPNPQVTSPVINFSTPGIYTITLASSNGTTSVYTKTIVVTTPTLYLSTNSQTVCEGKSAIFYANGVDTYTWEPGSVVNPMGVFNPLASQVYTCNATEINGCKTSGTVEVVVSPCVGIESYRMDELNLDVYPNPAKETVNLQINTGTNATIIVEITDAVGRSIRHENINGVSNSLTYPVDVSGFDNGIYFIRIEGLNGSARTVKFIKGN